MFPTLIVFFPFSNVCPNYSSCNSKTLYRRVLLRNTVAKTWLRHVARTPQQVSTHPEFVEAEDIENKNAIKHAWVSRAGSELPARSSRLFRSCRSCRRLCKLRHEMVMWQKGGIQSRFDKSLLSSRGVVTSEAPLSAVSKSARMLTPTRLL